MAFMNHILLLWDTIIAQDKNIQELYIVAHSYGGCSVLHLLEERTGEVWQKVKGRKIILFLMIFKGIAFTDSVHSAIRSSDIVSYLLSQRAVQYCASSLNKGATFECDKFGCTCKSAGTTSHEETTMSVIDEVINYIYYIFNLRIIRFFYNSKTKRIQTNVAIFYGGQ